MKVKALESLKAKSELTKLLGSPQPTEQLEAVKRLFLAPVVELVIRLDTRTGQTTFNLIGAQVPPAFALQMLDRCRDQIHAVQLEAVAKNGVAGQNGHAPAPDEGQVGDSGEGSEEGGAGEPVETGAGVPAENVGT